MTISEWASRIVEMKEDTIFTRIIDGEIPAEFVHRGERLVVFKDISPQAPIHFLIVPIDSSCRDVAALAEKDPDLLVEMVHLAGQLAREHANGEFRLIFNTGVDAGQTVFHVHAHLLAGELKEASLGG